MDQSIIALLAFFIIALGLGIILYRGFIIRYDLDGADDILGDVRKIPGYPMKAAFVVLSLLFLLFAGFAVVYPMHLLVDVVDWRHDPIAVFISQRWLIVPLAAVGVLFYWLRGRFPLAYGLIEIYAALATMWVAIATEADLGTRVLALLGAVYIMVRGLDNLDKGLPKQFRSTWDSLFPKHV